MNDADLIPEKEFAARLGRTVNTARWWRRVNKAPPCYDINGRIFYYWPEVQSWLAARRR